MFFSTRNSKLKITPSQAIINGISDDGGLYLPYEIRKLELNDHLLSCSYQELAYEILSTYFEDFSKEELEKCINSAYDKNHFEEKILDVHTFSNHSFLELFHGTTLTFKDMALSLLPYMMVTAKNKLNHKKDIHILTATSGDTGSAVLSSFSKTKGIRVSILYPDDGISKIQEKQMLYFTSAYSRAYALKDSNFDDCQTLIKNLLVKGSQYEQFSSANSINVARLLPQITYYFYSYIKLVNDGVIKLGQKIDVIVPTGNFGDIFAGYLAKMMSLPIDKLVIASNENKILTDFFSTGIYDLRREFYKTNSPSMDILISSNLERLLYLIIKDDQRIISLMNDLKSKKYFELNQKELEKLRADFISLNASQSETETRIKECYENENYLLDPHTAVAYSCFKKYKFDNHVLIISTASPLKFPSTICKSLGLNYHDDTDALMTMVNSCKIKIPNALNKVLNEKTRKKLIDKDEFEKAVSNKFNYIISTSATSANLGPGFDVLGISLSLYNTYSCIKNDKDELYGFEKEYSNSNNLVLKAYQFAFKNRNLPYQPIRLTQVKADIPNSRGLGSSSSCIIAGLLLANAILNDLYTEEELLDLAIKLEGHPDNVASCLLSGLVSNTRIDNSTKPLCIPVSDNLQFLVFIPSFKTSTEEARKLLKKEYSLEDITSNSSHLPSLLMGFMTGDLNLIYDGIEDKIHVSYRKKMIKDFNILNDISKELHIPFTISGSGSTMIFILDKNSNQKEMLINKIKSYDFPYSYELKTLDINKNKAFVKKEVLHNEK